MFLGVIINYKRGTCTIGEHRTKQILALLRPLCEPSSGGKPCSTTVRDLQSLIGILSWASAVIPAGRGFHRRLTRILTDAGYDKSHEHWSRPPAWTIL